MKLAERWFVRGPLAAVALASGAAGQYWLVGAFAPLRAAIAWAVAAMAFVLLCLLDRSGRELPAADEPLAPALEWPLALAVIATGVFFRTFHLEQFPPGLNHDAAWNGLYAAQILQGIPYTPYVASAWGRESLPMYLQAAAMKLVGHEHLATMLPAVAAMVLMLPLFYLWVRAMFAAPAALAATLFLGATGWPLVYGRIGWGAGLQPAFTTMTCLFFWRGLLRARVSDFALSGVGLALTLNTYNASRIFPALFPLFALAYLAQHRNLREQWRRYWIGVTAMFLEFAVVIAPLAWYAATHWIQFMGRANALYAPTERGWANFKAAALLFNFFGNSDDFFVKTPLLEAPAAVCFVFGVLWCLVRLFDTRALFLALGLLIGLVPGLITRPNANHCVGALPFTYIFAGLGLLYFVRQFARLGRAGLVGALALAFLVGAAQVRATYSEYLGANRRDIWGYYPETTVLGRYMRTLAGRYAIWVGGANFPRDTLTYFTYMGEGDPFQRQYTWVDDLTSLLNQPPQPPPGRGLALILSTIDASPGVFAQLLPRYPEHEIVDLRYPVEDGPVFARALLVERAAVPAPMAEPAAAPAGPILWTGGRGFAPGQFNTPKGIARGERGEFYIADTLNHRVQKFDASGAFVAAWGHHGREPGLFNEPHALALDHEGNVHVVDTWNHRIQKLAPDGKVLAVYTPAKGFFGPRGIALTQNRAYVTDGGNNQVVVFDLAGKYIATFGQAGSAAGQLMQPVGIAVDRQGLIWVVDSGNNRLQAFAAEGGSVRTLPVPNWQGDQIKEGYLVMAGDRLILTDPVSERLLQLRGEQLEVLEAGTQLVGPSGIAADKTTLYVTERSRHAVVRVAVSGPPDRK
ncbi:MAG: 6-bladed beta-propeller [Deltaproteobacteria bacterium]|nr:6-bladed beta-propeller [Deltaproteobacteria bacterium]